MRDPLFATSALALLLNAASTGMLMAAGPAAGIPDSKCILRRVQEIASGMPASPPGGEERAELLARTAQAQVEIGDVSGVRRTVEASSADRPRGGFDEAATSRVVEGLLLIATAQQTSGDRGAAAATLRQASSAPVDDMTIGNKAVRLARIAALQARIGERGAAAATARLSVEEAVRLPVSIPRWPREFGYTRAYALHRAALVLSEAGDGKADEVMKLAGRAAEGIEDPEHRQQTLVALVMDLARGGDFAGAAKVLASPGLKDRILRERLLAGVAVEQARLRDYDGALRTVDLIQGLSERAEALLKISRRLSEAGRWAEAGATARHAMKTMPSMPSAKSAMFLPLLAEARLRAGDRVGALTTARQVVRMCDGGATAPGPASASLLAWIAPTLAAAGERVEAGVALERASALAEAEAVPAVRRLRQAEVGGARAKLGDFDGAMGIYSVVADPADQASAHLLTEIVSGLVRAGNMPEALRRLAAMRPGPERAGIAASVAAEQAKLREDRWAIAWADHQETPSAKARALLAIAREFIDRQGDPRP